MPQTPPELIDKVNFVGQEPAGQSSARPEPAAPEPGSQQQAVQEPDDGHAPREGSPADETRSA